MSGSVVCPRDHSDPNQFQTERDWIHCNYLYLVSRDQVHSCNEFNPVRLVETYRQNDGRELWHYARCHFPDRGENGNETEVTRGVGS